MDSKVKALPNKHKTGHRFVFTYFAIILILIVSARAASYLCTLSSTDIAYPEWVETVTSYLSEILDAVRRAVSYTAIVCAVYFGCGTKTTISVSLLTLADLAVRFFIDYFGSAISGTEIVAILWLGADFVYELIFMILTCILSRIVHLKSTTEDNPRKAKRYTSEKALLYSVILYCVSRLAFEVIYLIDFLVSYVNITNTEIASIVGSFLKIFVIYGGISYIAAYVILPMLSKAKNKDISRLNA